MSALGAFESAWLVWMAEMAWQVTLLALAAWIVTRLLRRSSAAFRHAVWLVVFLRLALPPSLSTPWSVGTWLERWGMPAFPVGEVLPVDSAGEHPAAMAQDTGVAVLARGSGAEGPRRENTAHVLVAVWGLVAAALFAFMVAQSRRYARLALRDAEPVGAGLHEAAAFLARDMGLRRPPAVLTSPHLSVPAVLGFRKPVILLPDSLAGTLSESQMVHVLGHEMAHVARHDVHVAWFVSLLVCLYWFHPVVWLANHFLRREREMSCDDAVLYQTRPEGRDYAQTLVRVAEGFRAPVPGGAGFLGMLEISDNLLLRMQSCMDAMRGRRLGMRSLAVLGVFIVLLLPMGVWPGAVEGQADPNAAPPPPPRLARTEPANQASEVEPSLERITLVFDRDMAGGFSWTGGPPLFPETTGKPQWVDRRTCVLPVKLEPGRLYRVGINSKSHRNFRSAEGVPVAPGVLVFATKGADAALLAGLQPPVVVSMSPESGATALHPGLTELVVTFDRAMGGGFSWTGGGENYPETTGPPAWSEDRKTCRLPVNLKPGRSYRLGLNSPSHINFQSASGVPLRPVVWTFSTAAE